MEHYRLFVAAELPPPVIASLQALQQQLSQCELPVRWGAPASLHLTLVFLGDTPVTRVAAIAEGVEQAVRGQASHVLAIGRAGAFPTMRRPRVVWAAVDGALAELGALQAALVAALVPLGFQPERRAFTPHLTIGHTRRNASPADLARLGEALAALAPPSRVTWVNEEIALIRSELLPAGPQYARLAEYRLRAH